MKKAVEWYAKAVERHEAGSLCNLGWCYLYGEGVEENLEMGIRYIKRSMDGNDAAAIAILGFCYEFGRGVELNVSEAISLYNKSAVKKNVWGLSNLARLYEEGKGVEKNLAKSKDLYAQVEECDDPDLLCMLAESYGTGKSVCRNMEKKLYLLSCVALKTANSWPAGHKHLPDKLKEVISDRKPRKIFSVEFFVWKIWSRILSLLGSRNHFDLYRYARIPERSFSGRIANVIGKDVDRSFSHEKNEWK